MLNNNKIVCGVVELKNKTKIAVTILTILFFSEVILITTAKTQQITITKKQDNILIVDINGSGGYNTIQEAINDCETDQIIIVKNGIYKEVLDITKTVKIMGEENTVINPISEKNKYAIRLGAPNIVLNNLTIKNGAPGLYTSGIRISAPNTKIYNSNFYDTPIGIVVWTSNNTIENCTFRKCQDEGIALLGSTFSKCENNIIKNSIFENNGDGIELQYASNNKILNCKFFNNTHSGIAGIANSNNNNLISNCRIYNNDVHGIYFSSSNNNTIEKSRMYNNKDGDIYFRGNSKNNKISNDNIFYETKNIENFFLYYFNKYSSTLLSIIFKKNY